MYFRRSSHPAPSRHGIDVLLQGAQSRDIEARQVQATDPAVAVDYVDRGGGPVEVVLAGLVCRRHESDGMNSKTIARLGGLSH
jgi:hypothetical protein